MSYACTAPWPLKLAIFGAATLTGYGASPETPAPDTPDAALRACFVALVLFTLASVMPSLVYSVRCRRETTTFITQSALMLAACGSFIEYLLAADAATCTYACVSLLVLATHYLYMLFRAISRSPKLLLYSKSVAGAGIVLAVVVVIVLVPRLPVFRMHGVVSIGVLFAGEVFGFGVFLLDAVLCAVAEGTERALL